MLVKKARQEATFLDKKITGFWILHAKKSSKCKSKSLQMDSGRVSKPLTKTFQVIYLYIDFV